MVNNTDTLFNIEFTFETNDLVYVSNMGELEPKLCLNKLPKCKYMNPELHIYLDTPIKNYTIEMIEDKSVRNKKSESNKLRRNTTKPKSIETYFDDNTGVFYVSGLNNNESYNIKLRIKGIYFNYINIFML